MRFDDNKYKQNMPLCLKSNFFQIFIVSNALETWLTLPYDKRVVDPGTGTVETTEYVYRDEDVMMEFRVDPATGQRWVRNVSFHGTLGVDDPVAVDPCDDAACAVIQPLVYARDHLNSVEALYDVAAKAMATYGYSTFGVPTGSVSSLQPNTYTAREWEGHGMMHYRNRMYQTNKGIFNSIDIVRIISEYKYVYNNPILYTDPFGLETKRCGAWKPTNKNIKCLFTKCNLCVKIR